MQAWISQHRKLSAAVGVVTVTVTAFIAATEIWRGFSNEPLVPALTGVVQTYLPSWPKLIAIGFWVIVTLLALVTFVFIARSEKESKGSPSPSEPTHHEPTKTFTTVTAEILCSYYRDNSRQLADHQGAEFQLADYKAEPEIGRWLQVAGVLSTVSPSLNGCRVYLEDPDISHMSFSGEHWKDRLLRYNKGDEIIAVGKIESVDGYGVRLNDCELLLD